MTLTGPDYALIGGLVLALASLPSILSALADRRSPGGGILVLVAGAGLAGWAWYAHPGGYALADIPMIVIEMVARVVN